nr:hypothetical protein [Tanacetum cinerariifolium]
MEERTRDACLVLGKVAEVLAIVMKGVENGMAGYPPSEVYIGLVMLVCCWESGENSGDVTEVEEKRMAGILGLTATVDAIQTGKKTVTVTVLGVGQF